MTAESPIRYEKLPGHRRGLIVGSSVWLAPDHLLLVKSKRLNEVYKRFYFRDIKAIGIADTRRFHISARSLAIGAAWFLAFVIASANRIPWASALWLVLLLMAIVWAYLSWRKVAVVGSTPQ